MQSRKKTKLRELLKVTDEIAFISNALLIKQKVIYSVFIMKVYSTPVNFAVFDSCM